LKSLDSSFRWHDEPRMFWLEEVPLGTVTDFA